jgi:hypothetical protein
MLLESVVVTPSEILPTRPPGLATKAIAAPVEGWYRPNTELTASPLPGATEKFILKVMFPFKISE